MSSLRFAKSIFVSTLQEEPLDAQSTGAASPNRLLLRRALAELIDRAVPLPFLALLFPRWAVVIFVYQLLCDCSPNRRSVGKWLCRLRVISTVATDSAPRCQWWQAVLRRIGSAAAQTAWCLWVWLPVVMAYELITVVCVLLSPAGLRLEDFVAGTRVVTERQFRHMRKRAS